MAADFALVCVCSLGGAAFPGRAAGRHAGEQPGEPGQSAQPRAPSRALPSRGGGRAARGVGAAALEVRDRDRPRGAGSCGLRLGEGAALPSSAAGGPDGPGAASRRGRPVGAAGAEGAAPLRRRPRSPPPPPPQPLPGGAAGAAAGTGGRGGTGLPCPGGRRGRSGAGLPYPAVLLRAPCPRPSTPARRGGARGPGDAGARCGRGTGRSLPPGSAAAASSRHPLPGSPVPPPRAGSGGRPVDGPRTPEPALRERGPARPRRGWSCPRRPGSGRQRPRRLRVGSCSRRCSGCAAAPRRLWSGEQLPEPGVRSWPRQPGGQLLPPRGCWAAAPVPRSRLGAAGRPGGSARSSAVPWAGLRRRRGGCGRSGRRAGALGAAIRAGGGWGGRQPVPAWGARPRWADAGLPARGPAVLSGGLPPSTEPSGCFWRG